MPGKFSAPQWIVSTVRGACARADAIGHKEMSATTEIATAVGRRESFRRRMSERQLCRELNLTRRAGLAGRKARPQDLAERRAADDSSGRSEVDVVEHIEGVRAKLHAILLCDEGLHHR